MHPTATPLRSNCRKVSRAALLGVPRGGPLLRRDDVASHGHTLIPGCPAAVNRQEAAKGPSASLAPSAARSTYSKYASRAAVGRRLASGPFAASCRGELGYVN